MHTLYSLIIIGFNRAFLSGRFMVSVFGIVLVLFLTSFQMISPLSDVISVVMISGSGNFTLIIGLLPLIPYATTFATEWEERATSFWLIRSGVKNYVVSKIIVSAISGFMTTFIAILLYALILLIKLPFFTKIATGDAYVSLLEMGMPIRYLLFSAAHLSLSSALFATVALWVSTYIPNRFTTIVAPIVLYFMLYRLTRFWDLPPYLNLGTLLEGTYQAGSPLTTMMLKLGIVMVFCIIIGCSTVGQIRRRVQHD